jgi:NADH-quinone oxidoreductase subunit N
MIALITLFGTGLITLFIAFLKKPVLVALTATVGLLGALVGMYCEFTNGIILFPNYQGLDFNATSVLFSMVCIAFTLLLIWSGYKPLTEDKSHAGDHIALILFSLCGALVMTAFTDFFMFFIGLEILSIPVYVLAGMKKSDAFGIEASLKYFLTGAFATGILLFGIAWIYGATGSLSLYEIQTNIINSSANSTMLYVGILLVLASFLFKIGAVPYHFWSPDVYSGSTMTVMGYMATVIKIVGFAALLRLFTETFVSVSELWVPILLIVSILSMFVGNLSAIKQTRVRRLLAYSSIAHVGYTLLAVVTFNKVDSAYYYFNVYYYLTAYALATIILVTIGNSINDDEDLIENWTGIARKNPLIGLFVVMAFLSLAGVPPLMGFFGKYLVFTQAIQDYPIVVALALLNSGIAVYYYLSVVMKTLKKPENEDTTVKLKICPMQWVVLAVCASLLLLGGFILPIA